MTRTSPLSRRILLVTLAGGVVVALVALVLTVPVVQGVARDQAREELVRSVDSLAAKPAAAARLIAQEQKVLGRDDRRYAIVRRGGNVTGAAGELLTDEQVSELLATGTLSATSTVDGETILIEGRKTKRGFSAVAVQPVAGVDEATSALRRRLLLALLVGLVAAGTLGLILSRTLTRSVAVSRRRGTAARGGGAWRADRHLVRARVRRHGPCRRLARRGADDERGTAARVPALGLPRDPHTADGPARICRGDGRRRHRTGRRTGDGRDARGRDRAPRPVRHRPARPGPARGRRLHDRAAGGRRSPGCCRT